MTRPVVIGLNAVIMAVDGESPRALMIRGEGQRDGLPFGTFEPERHRTFELALRQFVAEQTGFSLGYVEQLYTFGDRGREAPLAELAGAGDARVVSVGYLALTPRAEPLDARGGVWEGWYRYFPWEDHRGGPPALLAERLRPRLRAWADEAGSAGRRESRWDRARVAFGFDGREWNAERALDRYELLYEAEQVPEAAIDAARAAGRSAPETGETLGRPMASDHRRILATAISRLRAKIAYRPVLFELAPETFTLRGLQDAAEAIVGYRLHAQNFRRALDRSGLVESTGAMETETGGRPAQLYRFRREILREQPALGVALPRLRDS